MSITLQVCELMGVPTPIKRELWKSKVVPDPECAKMLFVTFTPIAKEKKVFTYPEKLLESEPPVVIAVGAFEVAKIWLNQGRVVALQLWSCQLQQYHTSFVNLDSTPDDWWISFLHNWAVDEGLLLAVKDQPISDLTNEQLKGISH